MFLQVYIHRQKKNNFKIQEYAIKVTTVYKWFLFSIPSKLNTINRCYFYTRKSILRVSCLFISVTRSNKHYDDQPITLSLPFSLASWPMSFVGMPFFPQKRESSSPQLSIGEAMVNRKWGGVKRRGRTDNIRSRPQKLAETGNWKHKWKQSGVVD